MYPIDLYGFMDSSPTKEKGPRGGIRRPRGLRPLEGRVHNAQQQPSSSTVALTRATSAPRQVSRRTRVNGVVNGHEAFQIVRRLAS